MQADNPAPRPKPAPSTFRQKLHLLDAVGSLLVRVVSVHLLSIVELTCLKTSVHCWPRPYSGRSVGG